MARAEAEIGTNLEYARIQEFGGTIVPKGQFLRWVNDAGEEVFARSVTIPARPYLRPAFDMKEREAVDAMAAVLRKVVEARGR